MRFHRGWQGRGKLAPRQQDSALLESRKWTIFHVASSRPAAHISHSSPLPKGRSLSAWSWLENGERMVVVVVAVVCRVFGFFFYFFTQFFLDSRTNLHAILQISADTRSGSCRPAAARHRWVRLNTQGAQGQGIDLCVRNNQKAAENSSKVGFADE